MVQQNQPNDEQLGTVGTKQYHAQHLQTVFALIQECDTRCTYKQPKSIECGSGEECICIPYKAEICHPKQAEYKCFKAVKELVANNFMCADAETNHTCVQCHKWKYEKKTCPETNKKVRASKRKDFFLFFRVERAT